MLTGHAPLQILQFFLHRLLSFQAGELVVQVFRQSEVVSLDATFDIIDTARVLLESHHRVFDLIVVDLAARGKTTVGGLVTREQGFLPGLRILEFCLEACDVFIQLGKAFVNSDVVTLERIGCRRDA